jgi:hypothetical protein
MSKFFSVCIPTMNRYNEFLSINIPKYLTNNFIDEIIICDETGLDYDKIKENFSKEIESKKIILEKNDIILGPFLNKIKTIKFAKNEWIVLLDSDNFADIDYFEIAHRYIIDKNINKTSIISPSFAFPNFSYKHFENKIFKKENIKEFRDTYNFTTMMNTGNYILNKYLINNLDLSNEFNIDKSHSIDVVLMNTLFFEQFKDLEFHIVENLHYSHIVHKNSIWIQTYQIFQQYNEIVLNRFKNL